MSEAANFSVTCRVECAPSCAVSWLRDGDPIAVDDDDRFSVDEEYLPADEGTNDLESVRSTLTWMIAESWPEGRLDREADGANYTCRSTANAAGEGVESTTYFRVECKWIVRPVLM